MPGLYIITGSNGAGKSTIGPNYLPDAIRENYKIFDGDLLYTQNLKALFPAVIKSAKYARQAALENVIELFEEQTHQALLLYDNYVYEGHFTNDETWNKPQKFKAAGYQIHLIFFGLQTPELSRFRVTERVLEGGHYVDPQTLANNFYGNLEKLNIYLSLIDNLTILDTSKSTPHILFKMVENKVDFCSPFDQLPPWFLEYLPTIVKLVY